MTAQVLDGEAVAAGVRSEVAERVHYLRERGTVPGLGTILVGDDGPSARYVALKHADCAEVGIDSFHEHLPADVSQDDLHAVILRFNADPAVHSILLQLPLPSGLDEERALLSIDPAKDVDGIHPVNLGRLVMGRPGPLSCTPAGIVELLTAYGVPIEGRHVVVIGRGLTIGRPLALLLTLKRPGCNAAVTVVHTGVPDIAPTTSCTSLPACRGRLRRRCVGRTQGGSSLSWRILSPMHGAARTRRGSRLSRWRLSGASTCCSRSSVASMA